MNGGVPRPYALQHTQYGQSARRIGGGHAAAVDTGLSYRASNELFRRFPENVAEKGGNDATSDNIGSPPASFRLYSGLLKSSRTRKVILLFADGAGLPQDAPKDGKNGAAGSPKIQLADLFAGQYHGGTKFSVGALKVSHWLCPITLSASHDDGQ
jgi:hypothetical protein